MANEQEQPSVNSVFPGGIDKESIQLTEGEHVMNVSFQPSGRNDVWDLKRRLAELYDWLIKECSKTQEDLERYNRKQRCMRIALTHLEHFQMNSTKAITYRKESTEDEKVIRLRQAPTDGQLAMTVSFNVAEGELAQTVAYIKDTCANLQDEMQDELHWHNEYFKKQEADFYTDYAKKAQEAFDLLSPEEKEVQLQKRSEQRGFTTPDWPDELKLDCRKLQHAAGAMDEALFYLRQFQMFAVKAVTR